MPFLLNGSTLIVLSICYPIFDLSIHNITAGGDVLLYASGMLF